MTEHTDEEIRENMERRLGIAVNLLGQHPNVTDIRSSEAGLEFMAYFSSVNPDTDTMDILLDLERWESTLVNINGELSFRVGWDVKNEYHTLSGGRMEEWAEEYEWPMAEYEDSIEDILQKAGWSKDE